MASYPFIDIAVLDGVRERFAKGDALLVLNEGLDTVLWANGAGARLLGHADLEACIGAPPAFGLTALRQLRGTRGFPHIGENRALVMRITQGLSSSTVAFSASSLNLPDLRAAILLASPAKDVDLMSVLSGIAQAGHEAALTDAEGLVLASSAGFDLLGLAGETLSGLARDVKNEHDRLIKRMAPCPGGRIPVGIGRLAEDPQVNLLIAVNDVAADEVPAAPAMTPGPAAALPEDDKDDAPVRPFGRRQAFEPYKRAGVDRWYFHGDDGQPGERLVRDEPKRPAPSPEPDRAAPRMAVADPAAQPVRFSWRTDAEGRFSAISDEFVRAVGGPAADVIGRQFTDVARVFGMDGDGEIAALLARRDTWSGRSVLWPVSDTDLRAPVDLAALPAYSRDRQFEGFKGFGVLRLGDAVRDPEAIGLALAGRTAAASSAAGEAEPDVPEAAAAEIADPFMGEIPALAPSAAPERRDSDKVIRLAEHRPALTTTEQSAFREIADRLAKDGLARPAEDAEQRDAGGETPEAPVMEAPVMEGPAETAALPAIDEVRESEPRGEETEEDAQTGAGFITDHGVLDRLPLPLLVHSGDVLHHANDEFLAFTGYSSLAELEAAGGIGALFQSEPDDSGTGKVMRLVTLQGEKKPVEAHLQSIPWGQSKALLLSLRPMAPDPVAAPAPMAAANRELELRVAELDTILDTATDGIVLIGMDGRIRSLSRAAEALFGFDSGEVAGKPFVSLFAVESQKAARDYLAGLTENGVASVLNDGREVIGRESRGRFIPLFMTIGRLPADSGFCAVLRDITHWKRAEEELSQARRLAEAASAQKTDFLARISHEIRTPLNAIIGFSELMLDEKFGPVANERYRDYLRDINRSGSHVLDLVNDLLDISKIEAGAQEMHFEAVSLNEALAEAVSMMQPMANRERVIIRSSLSSALPDVVADLRAVKQIALNLLSNAVRFTNAGGQVIVSTSYEMTGDVIMRVRDTGIGMSRSEIDVALKPFRQVQTLRSGRTDGTGLGLPLTKAMVEANRAKFSIHSTPGEGTMIEVSFPSTRVLAQ